MSASASLEVTDTGAPSARSAAGSALVAGLPAGVVFVPFHYGDLGEEHAANNLTPSVWDPVSQQPVQKAAAVRLEAVAAAATRVWWHVEASR